MNLLLINADQLRHDCVGYRGLRDVKTPNIDKLAAGGVVFTNAFTPLPVCAPARQALLSGRHPDRFGAFWNYDMVKTQTVKPEWCWPPALREAGYQTAYLGRFHVSPDQTPVDFGYDKHISWAGHKQLLAEKYSHVTYQGGWLGERNPVPVEDAGTHWMADRAAEVIEEYAGAGRPWHIWVDYEEPHLPCRPSGEFADMYDPADIPPWDGFDDGFTDKPYCHRQQMINWRLEGKPWKYFAPMVARYYGMISQLDDAIGRILAALERSGQAGETIVAFTSDHGDMCGSHRMLDKHYVLYDDIVRVPLIVKHPGYPARVSDSFVSNCLDLPASFEDWLGIGPGEIVDGRPLPLVREQEEGRPDYAVSSSNGQQFGFFNCRMITNGEWKYVWNLTDIDELYNLVDDPGELHNLISDSGCAERIAEMRATLHAELKSHGDWFALSGWLDGQLLENRKHTTK